MNAREQLQRQIEVALGDEDAVDEPWLDGDTEVSWWTRVILTAALSAMYDPPCATCGGQPEPGGTFYPDARSFIAGLDCPDCPQPRNAWVGVAVEAGLLEQQPDWRSCQDYHADLDAWLRRGGQRFRETPTAEEGE